MSSPVDPNDVMMTGENSFVRLSHDGGKTLADRWSHWRVLWCPAGPGHVLLVQAELTGGKPRLYSDNIAMTRWLQKAIESMLFPPTADVSIPVIEASFERSGDPRAVATERIVSASDEILMSWYDFNEPFVLTMAPGTANRPIGVFSTFFPARGDNQALATANREGQVTYDLAFALVWAEGDGVLNVNEAHAYASCSDCVAVAVAFQVVLIMDDASVVVPQNLAVAANYDCYRCITAAIARAARGVSARVETEVAMAFAESWKPFVYVKPSATPMVTTSAKVSTRFRTP